MRLYSHLYMYMYYYTTLPSCSLSIKFAGIVGGRVLREETFANGLKFNFMGDSYYKPLAASMTFFV